jgi:hypothetical protein
MGICPKPMRRMPLRQRDLQDSSATLDDGSGFGQQTLRHRYSHSLPIAGFTAARSLSGTSGPFVPFTILGLCSTGKVTTKINRSQQAMNLKREVYIDDGPRGSWKAVYNNSSGDVRQRGRKTHYTLLETVLWVFALVGWGVFAYLYLHTSI